MAYTIGDAVEILVVTKRGKQPEWIPATVTRVLADPDRIEVTYHGGAWQRFLTTEQAERIRTPQAAEEGAEWVFSTF